MVVGGLPGSGKSTTIAAVRALLEPSACQPVVVDPDRHRRRFARLLPAGTPYRAYRWLVHVLHHVEIVLRLLAGPVLGYRARPLLVHSTATRARRRALLAGLASRLGWRTTLVLLDVDPATARRSQVQRGRVLAADSFARHVARWNRLGLDDSPPTAAELGGWDRALVVGRRDAATIVARVLDATAPSPQHPALRRG